MCVACLGKNFYLSIFIFNCYIITSLHYLHWMHIEVIKFKDISIVTKNANRTGMGLPEYHPTFFAQGGIIQFSSRESRLLQDYCI